MKTNQLEYKDWIYKNKHGLYMLFISFGDSQNIPGITSRCEICKDCKTAKLIFLNHAWKIQICISFSVFIVDLQWAKSDMLTIHLYLKPVTILCVSLLDVSPGQVSLLKLLLLYYTKCISS